MLTLLLPVVFLPSVVLGQFAYKLPTDAELTLTSRLNPSFSCEGRPYGYYADQGNNCEIFHICLPVQDQAGVIQETLQYSFACPNTTVFDQSSLTCNYPEYSVPCSQAASFYGYVEFGKKEGRSGRLFEGATGGEAAAAVGPSNINNLNSNNFVSIQELPFLNVQGTAGPAQGSTPRRQANRRPGGRGRAQRRNNY